MEQMTKEPSASEVETSQAAALVRPSQGYGGGTPSPSTIPCPTCAGGAGAMTAGYVYAFGGITAVCGKLSVEKEIAQVRGRTSTAGQTDHETLFNVLSKPENRYLARQMCWVFTVQGLETYLLAPRDPADYERLVHALHPHPSPMNLNVLVGVRGPIAPPELCNGLMVPIVMFDQLYSFNRDELLKALGRPDGMSEEQFEAAAAEVLDRILQMTDNAGATDDQRATNYLAARYDAPYRKTAEQFGRGFSLSAVDTRPSSLSGTRKIVEVIFSYTDRSNDFTEKFCVRVDVTEEFPFLVSKLAPYYDR